MTTKLTLLAALLCLAIPCSGVMIGAPPIPGKYDQDAKELNEWIQFQERLTRAVIPELVFKDTPFEEALKTIRAECHNRAEMTFEIVLDPETWKPEPLTLRLRNVSAAEILQILAGLTGYGFRLRNESLIVSPAGDYVIERAWKVEAELAHVLDHLPDKFSDDKPLGAFIFNRSKGLLTFREDQKKVDHANEILKALGIAEFFISSNNSVENLAP
jgi:hypothetical protein